MKRIQQETEAQTYCDAYKLNISSCFPNERTNNSFVSQSNAADNNCLCLGSIEQIPADKREDKSCVRRKCGVLSEQLQIP